MAVHRYNDLRWFLPCIPAGAYVRCHVDAFMDSKNIMWLGCLDIQINYQVEY